nr:16S rRNA (adenine(1518)-N(6)/adenine(1519)-N(6))-dimethyltransferase RsmA [Candidatus Sigynarchaeota archaeon]
MAENRKPFFLSSSELKNVLEQLGQVPRKHHGQNFLHSWPTIERVLDLCAFRHDDVALEIGPGLGAFTLNIAPRVASLHAIELNHVFAGYVQRAATALTITNLEIVVADALATEFPPSTTAVFSAMPYSISAPLTFKILEFLRQRRARAYVICQKEFGTKLVAPPGSSGYGRLSANASLLADVMILMEISRNNFYPVPEVDSVLVKIVPRMDIDEKAANACLNLTRGLFPYKNKVLRKAMAMHVANKALHGFPGEILDTMPFKERRVRELDRNALVVLARWYVDRLNKAGKNG